MPLLYRSLGLAIAHVLFDARVFLLARRCSAWAMRCPSGTIGRVVYVFTLPYRLVGIVLLWYLVVIVSFLRLFALMLALGVLVGLVGMAPLPFVAGSQRVEAMDVALRCLDSHPLDPFYLLAGGKSFQRPRQALSPDSIVINSMVISVPPNRQRARETIAELYPPEDSSIREQLNRWGEVNRVQQWGSGLFVLQRSQSRISNVNDELRLRILWHKLCAGHPLAGEDLPRLARLVHLAFPTEPGYAAALNWARALYGRLQANAEQYQVLIGGDKAVLSTVLPPLTEGTLWWILYQYVGLTEKSRAHARDRWLSYFPPNRTEQVLAWGRKLERERRKAGEPLPPTSDNVSLLCVIERLTGTDAYGDRCRRIVAEGVSSAWLRGPLQGAITFAYPNDDLLYLVAVGDPLALLSPQAGNSLGVFSHLILVCWGLRMWAFQILGLPLRHNLSFLRFRDRELHEWKGTLLAYAVVPFLLWPAAWLTLSPQFQLFVSSPGQLLGGVFAAVLLGGSLIQFLNRLIALVLIARGYELERIWLDEVLGAVLGAGVLYYFGNDLFSIVAFVTFAVVPEVLHRRRYSQLKDEPAQTSSQVEDQPPLHAGT